MGLAVFDIDGTLTDTTDVDVECYEAAVLSEIGLEIPSDWASFEDVTDAAVLAVACERQGIPVPGPRVQERIADKVGELLATATGAWRPSALVKLRGARIPHEGVPVASASDHRARVAIIRHAVRRMSPIDGPVVYVGDGVWDGRAAKALGYSFVGVARGPQVGELRAVGADAVISDFADTRSFLGHLGRFAE